MSETDNNKKKRDPWRKLFFVCLFLLIFCLGYMGMDYHGEKSRAEVYDKLAKTKKLTSTPALVEEPTLTPTLEPVTPTPVPETPTPKVEIPIDFEELYQINEDIYAWIEIPDTLVDYPIVQNSDDDTYYLNHTIEGAEGYPGSIYTESYNSTDFEDENTVIYGHNMKDGSMFGNLKKYMDGKYMSEHPYIYIYTPDHIRKYEIFAGVMYDDRHILLFYDFEDEEQYQAFLNSVNDTRNMSSHIREDVKVTPEDKILTLSTCMGQGHDKNRFLVEAVLIDEQ